MENLLDFLLFSVPIFCYLVLAPLVCYVCPLWLLRPPPPPPFSTPWPSPLVHKELCGITNCPLFTYSNIFQCLMMALHVNNFSDLQRAHLRLWTLQMLVKIILDIYEGMLLRKPQGYFKHTFLSSDYTFTTFSSIFTHTYITVWFLYIKIINTCFG